MSKHETKITLARETEAEFEARVESDLLKLRNSNGGRMPTNEELNTLVRTSMSRLCPVRRKIVDRLLTLDTKLAHMPEIPEELRLANDEALKAMWAKTRDLQNEEIVDIKRVMRARDEENRRSIEDLEGIIARLESERDEAREQAEESAELVAELQVELAETKAGLSNADARLAERDEMMKLMRAVAPSDTVGGEPADKKRPAARTKVNETPDLPLK
ncbi:MAG: hypothetical protein KDK53_06195 [Maritimibacter sp.]|nr:hypothetical protein [Maritimibacter sp.]